MLVRIKVIPLPIIPLETHEVSDSIFCLIMQPDTRVNSRFFSWDRSQAENREDDVVKSSKFGLQLSVLQGTC